MAVTPTAEPDDPRVLLRLSPDSPDVCSCRARGGEALGSRCPGTPVLVVPGFGRAVAGGCAATGPLPVLAPEGRVSKGMTDENIRPGPARRPLAEALGGEESGARDLLIDGNASACIDRGAGRWAGVAGCNALTGSRAGQLLETRLQVGAADGQFGRASANRCSS